MGKIGKCVGSPQTGQMQHCYARRCQSGLTPHQPPARTSWIRFLTKARSTLLRFENMLPLGLNWVGN